MTGVGGCFLIGMILLTCSNILLRQFGLPVRGTFEIMGFFGAMIFGLALAYSHEKKEHLAVTVVFDKLPQGIKAVLRRVSTIICSVYFALMAWQLVQKGLNLRRVGEISETLRIPYYPFILVVALGISVLVVLLILELLTDSGDTK